MNPGNCRDIKKAISLVEYGIFIIYASVSERQIVELRVGRGRVLQLRVGVGLLAILRHVYAACDRDSVEVGDIIHHAILLPPVTLDVKGDGHILPEPRFINYLAFILSELELDEINIGLCAAAILVFNNELALAKAFTNPV